MHKLQGCFLSLLLCASTHAADFPPPGWTFTRATNFTRVAITGDRAQMSIALELNQSQQTIRAVSYYPQEISRTDIEAPGPIVRTNGAWVAEITLAPGWEHGWLTRQGL